MRSIKPSGVKSDHKAIKKFDVGSLRREKRKEQAVKVGVYTILIVSALPIFFGYSWLFLNSFSRGLPRQGIIPPGFTLENWRFLWELPWRSLPDIWSVLWNTLLLAVGVTLMVVLVVTPAAYALSRLKFRGKNFVMMFMLILHSFPGVSLLIALFWVLHRLQLLNTIAGVILVQGGLFIPFAVWVMKGHFDGIPWDVEMSALIDGASRFKTWYKIMLPQVGPGIAAISIFAFIHGWSTYIYVIVFILQHQTWTLSKYMGAIGNNDWGFLAAVGTFYMIPIILFFLFTQKYLFKFAIGGTKYGD